MSLVKLETPFAGPPAGIGSGTGFVVQYCNRTCLIMTNRHVIAGALSITVVLPRQKGDQRFPGATVQESGPADLALVRLENVVAEFRPLLFAELPIPRLTGVVYCHGFFGPGVGMVIRPGRFPGQITGVYLVDDIQYLDGNFGSESGTSGGPITMGNRVIGVNVGSRGGSRRVLSPQSIYMTLVDWCRLHRGNPTFAEMLRRLAHAA
ncbi:unnamed protein product [Alopecurus aequalis]